MLDRVRLGVDGNCGFALLGKNLQEGEAEFEVFEENSRECILRAINRAFSRLKNRLNRPGISYYLDESHPNFL